MRPTSDRDLVRVAGVIGEPARAAMLSALLGGQELSAGELARRADVAPATATAHLARLVDGGLVTRRRDGRHRYFALANADVAAALEALARIAPLRADGRAAGSSGLEPNAALRYARTCYDHLAGSLGVRLTDALLDRDLLRGRDAFDVTAAGEGWLKTLGVDVEALRRSRRAFARPCLDWTERRNHLAGGVGAAIATAMMERRWVVRMEGTRAVRLTLRGREGLYRSLGLDVSL
jgi:DNA-binding transcriptional ArsR family regulator